MRPWGQQQQCRQQTWAFHLHSSCAVAGAHRDTREERFLYDAADIINTAVRQLITLFNYDLLLYVI